MNIKEKLQNLEKTVSQRAWCHHLKNDQEFWETTKELPEDFTIRERVYYILHDLTLEDITCKTCGKNLCRMSNKTSDGFRQFCSIKCSANNSQTRKKFEQTCQKIYGVNNPRQSKEINDKVEQTCIKIYGSKSPLGNKNIYNKTRKSFIKNHNGITSTFQLESSKNTIKEKFGVDNAAKSEIIKEKTKITNQERFGGNAPACNNNIKEKMKNSCLETYGSTSPLNSKECRQKGYATLREQNYEHLIEQLKSRKISLQMTKDEFIELKDGVSYLKCEICGKEFTSQYTHFLRIRCGCLNKSFSYAEVELTDFLLQFTDNIETGRFDIIPPYQLDIYLPDYNLAIEYDGIYWHSLQAPKPKDINYHLRKTELCEQKGIKLIHIFESEWINNKKWIKKIIQENLTGKTSLIFINESEIDKRYNTQKEIEDNGYTIEKIIKPKLRFFNNSSFIEFPKKFPTSYDVYDCGTFKVHK